MKVSEIQNAFLRGAFCSVWIFGTLMSLMFTLVASSSDYDDPFAPYYWHRALGSLVVVAIAGLCHGYLIWKKESKE